MQRPCEKALLAFICVLFFAMACDSKNADKSVSATTSPDASSTPSTAVSATTSIDVTGFYRGTEKGTQAGAVIDQEISLTLIQKDNEVAGTWLTASGSSGMITGTLKGNAIDPIVVMDASSLCPGTFVGNGIIEGEKITATIDGISPCGLVNATIEVTKGTATQSSTSMPRSNISVATASTQLKILVAYTDNSTYSPNAFTRLKLVSKLEFQQTSGYQYLGRAYAFTNGGDAFSVPIHEYFIPIDPRYSTIGFHYSMFNGSVPTYGWQPNRSAIAYVSSYPDFNRGVVALYQYATSGGVNATGNGNVAFTLNSAIIEGLRLSGFPVMWKIIGYVYHGTQADCDADRSPFCGSNIGASP